MTPTHSPAIDTAQHASSTEQFAAIGLAAGEITAMARHTVGDPAAEIGRWAVEPVDYAFGSPTTGGLLRVRGTARSRDADVPWSLFVKIVQSYRHWPLIGVLPAALREQALSSAAWRYEADVYTGRLGRVLPPGLRLPYVHAVKDLGDDHLALVLEDVPVSAEPWDAGRFARAAGLLGRMAVRLTRADALPATAFRGAGELTRFHVEGRVLVASLPALRSDATWSHPLLGGSASARLRLDMLRLAERLPALVAALARLPQLMVHADASPQNLLVPADASDELVAVDWTIGGLAAAGDDLGQLLIGLCHAGELSTDRLPSLHDLLVRAYTAGLGMEGMAVDAADVQVGMDGGLVVRSAFSALPYERLGGPVTDELERLVADRLALTRYLVDVGLSATA